MTRPKEAYGRKLLYQYSAGAILSMVICLLGVAIYVLTLFLPYCNITNGSQETNLLGIDFFKHFFCLFTGEVSQVTRYIDHFRDFVFDGNGLSTVIMNIVSYVMVFILLLMGAFAIVLFVGFMVLACSGKLNHWKLPYSITKRLFISSIFYYGIIVGINIYANLMKPNLIGGTGVYYPANFSYGFFGSLFVLTIFAHVVYCKCFKNRVYVKNVENMQRYLDEYQKYNSVPAPTPVTVIVNNGSNMPNTQPVVQQFGDSNGALAPIPVYFSKPEAPKKEVIDNAQPVAQSQPQAIPAVETKAIGLQKLPDNIRSIGGHEYAQNVNLEEATIPFGVETLGAGAFANCVNLKSVFIPASVRKIEYNCFYNCMQLARIQYGGTKESWRKIKRGSNWLSLAGTRIVFCRDGALEVNPEK